MLSRRAKRLRSVVSGLLLAASSALALRPYFLRLQEVSTAAGHLSFRQPDGTYTVLDLETGAVLSRADAPPRGGTPLAEVSCPVPSGPTACQTLLSRAPSVAPVLRRTGATLLLEATRPDRGGAILEAVDLETGRPLWLYAYPTWWTDGVNWEFQTRRVAEARAALVTLRGHSPEVLGLVPPEAAESAAGAAYPGRVEYDPDPGGASTVRRRVTLAWAGVASLAVVTIGLGLMMPAGPWKSRAAVLLSALAGLGLGRALTLDPGVTAAAVAAWLSTWGWAWRGATRPLRWLLACMLLAAGAHLSGLFVLPRIIR